MFGDCKTKLPSPFGEGLGVRLSAVNALGYTVWELKYDLHSETFRLELNDHLDDDSASSFCSQMPLTADYDGEGNNGSMFTLYI